LEVLALKRQRLRDTQASACEAIIAIAAVKLARTTNKRDPVSWMIAAILCAP
jgi:hypothetical protein